MRVSMIAALDDKNGIGIQNRLPWRLPDDARRFKTLTMGHHLISGRKTFESLGRPLPGRTHIVLSRNPSLSLPDGCFLVSSLEEALDLSSRRGEREVFVIGGTEVYALALPAAHRLYLTRVHGIFEADAYFPTFDMFEWVLEWEEDHQADERHASSFTYQRWERK